jgi:kumamolisin
VAAILGVGGVDSYPTVMQNLAWSSSGGGVATDFPLPSYQAGVSGLASPTARNVPDIAEPATNLEFFFQGYWNTYSGGTEFAVSIGSALIAETSQMCGKRLGSVNPAAYHVFAVSSYDDFADITSGNNGEYTAVPGYDNVTGIGVPLGYTFAQAMCS